MSKKTVPSTIVASHFCFFQFSSSRSRAQIGNASLGGTVTDQSAAAVVSANLTLTNAATAFKSKFTSEDRGEYSFRNLTPGTYELEVTKLGFEHYDQKNIVVTINQSARQEIALKAGLQTKTISVEVFPPGTRHHGMKE